MQDLVRGRGSTHPIEDAVVVEAGVNEERRVVDKAPYVAGIVWVGRRIGVAKQGERTVWRVGHILLQVPCVLALLCFDIELGHKRPAAGLISLRTLYGLQGVGTHFNENTGSYLCTKSTAGICVWAAIQPITARRGRVRSSLSRVTAPPTVCNPDALKVKFQGVGMFVDVVSEVCRRMVSKCSEGSPMTDARILTGNIHSCILPRLSAYQHQHKGGTHTLARQVELLPFQVGENFQELLQEANNVLRDVVLVLVGS